MARGDCEMISCLRFGLADQRPHANPEWKRKEKVNHNPPSDFVLKAGDVILFIGRREDVNRAIEYLESGNFI